MAIGKIVETWTSPCSAKATSRCSKSSHRGATGKTVKVSPEVSTHFSFVWPGPASSSHAKPAPSHWASPSTKSRSCVQRRIANDNEQICLTVPDPKPPPYPPPKPPPKPPPLPPLLPPVTAFIVFSLPLIASSLLDLNTSMYLVLGKTEIK